MKTNNDNHSSPTSVLTKNNTNIKLDDKSQLLAAKEYKSKGEYAKSLDILRALEARDNFKGSQYKNIVLLEISALCYKEADYSCTQERIAILDKQTNLSSNEKSSLAQIKSILEERKKRENRIFGSLGGGYMYDSNPAMSAASQDITLYGSSVDQENRRSDMGYMGTASLGYTAKITENFGIFGNALGSLIKYDQISDRDMLNVYFNQGLFYNYKKLTFSVPLNYTSLYIGEENTTRIDDFYVRTIGTTPSVSYNFGSISTHTSYRFVKKDYLDSLNVRNSNMQILSQYFRFRINNFNSIKIGAGYGKETAIVSYYDNDILNANISFRHDFQIAPLYLDMGYNLNKLDFHEYNPMLTTIRQDAFHTFSFKLNYMFRNTIETFISYSYMKNDSNTDLYNFSREQVMVGANWSF